MYVAEVESRSRDYTDVGTIKLQAEGKDQQHGITKGE
jgi:hypothetical protein